MSSNLEFWEDYEVLTVETPENLELRLPLAGFGPRFLAALLDYLIVSFGMAILAGLALALFGIAGVFSSEPSQAMIITMIIVVLAVVLFGGFGYYALFEWLWNGQTPGKRITGIRVLRRGGLPLTAREVVLRNLFRLVDMLPSGGLTGLISFFSTRNQQRLGDLVADTVVIREFGNRNPVAWMGAAGVQAQAPGLTAQLRYIIASYLGRAQSLPVEVRYQITDSIITRLGYQADQLGLGEREAYLAQILNWQGGTQG